MIARHILAAAAMLACAGHGSAYAAPAPAAQAESAKIVTTASGLKYEILAAGEGAKPGPTDFALVNYKGALTDGTVFDAQNEAAFPVADVVPGFGEGLQLMARGTRIRLWIPPELGYGARAQGQIPANATLIFDVELLDFITLAELMAIQDAAPPEAAPTPPQ